MAKLSLTILTISALICVVVSMSAEPRLSRSRSRGPRVMHNSYPMRIDEREHTYTGKHTNGPGASDTSFELAAPRSHRLHTRDIDPKPTEASKLLRVPLRTGRIQDQEIVVYSNPIYVASRQ